MKMNRRNVLLGLGAIATGGGAMFGSGAFSSVEADREATVTIAQDDAAGTNLEMVANATGGSVANNTGNANQVGINASSLNTRATTVFESAFDLTNNAPGSRFIAVSGVSSTIGTVTLIAHPDANADVANQVDLSSNAIEVNSGATLVVGLKVVADDVTAQTDNTTITIEAKETAAETTPGTATTEGPISSTN